MHRFKASLTAAAVAGGVIAATLGLGAPLASAEPPPINPDIGEVAPPNAPRKPADAWNGRPIVWTSMWGGRWGVWINGGFLTLTSNVNTNGG